MNHSDKYPPVFGWFEQHSHPQTTYTCECGNVQLRVTERTYFAGEWHEFRTSEVIDRQSGRTLATNHVGWLAEQETLTGNVMRIGDLHPEGYDAVKAVLPVLHAQVWN